MFDDAYPSIACTIASIPVAAVVFAGIPDLNNKKKVVLVAAFGTDIVNKGLHAGNFLAPIAKHCGGGGGGRPDFAQAGGRDSKELDAALLIAKTNLIQELN